MSQSTLSFSFQMIKVHKPFSHNCLFSSLFYSYSSFICQYLSIISVAIVVCVRAQNKFFLLGFSINVTKKIANLSGRVSDLLFISKLHQSEKLHFFDKLIFFHIVMNTILRFGFNQQSYYINHFSFNNLHL